MVVIPGPSNEFSKREGIPPEQWCYERIAATTAEQKLWLQPKPNYLSLMGVPIANRSGGRVFNAGRHSDATFLWRDRRTPGEVLLVCSQLVWRGTAIRHSQTERPRIL